MHIYKDAYTSIAEVASERFETTESKKVEFAVRRADPWLVEGPDGFPSLDLRFYDGISLYTSQDDYTSIAEVLSERFETSAIEKVKHNGRWT
jgi:excinuclease UvrABC nuclease subunit